jgi:hypothetical protein
VATRTEELPVDTDLYLPESWASDRKRCRTAHNPDEVGYRPKWRIALDLAERAVAAGYPPGLVLGDSAFGDVGDFRDGIRALDLDYALDVKVHTRVRIVCEDGSITNAMNVADVAMGPHARGAQRADDARASNVFIAPVKRSFMPNYSPRQTTPDAQRPGHDEGSARDLGVTIPGICGM